MEKSRAALFGDGISTPAAPAPGASLIPVSVMVEEAAQGKRNIHRNIEGSQLKLGEFLAKGAFGSVFAGTYEGKKVAIKVIRIADFSPYEMSCLRRELAIQSVLNHPNLLPCLAAGFDSEKAVIVLPFMEKGQMSIAKLKSAPLKTRLRYALQIAEGMKYFSDNGFIHRDLKPANILIEAGDNLRIADFGLARDVPPRRGMQATVGVGTPFYLAPELFGKGGRYGGEVDVYSYGIMLWELATGVEAWTNSKINTMIELERQVKAKKRPNDYVKVAIESRLENLIEDCWHGTGSSRPSWAKIVQELKEMTK